MLNDQPPQSRELPVEAVKGEQSEIDRWQDLRYYQTCWMIAAFEKLKTWPLKLSLILSYTAGLYIGGKNQRSSARYTHCHLRKLPK